MNEHREKDDISTEWLPLEPPYEDQEGALIQALEEAGALRQWATEEMRKRWDAVEGTAKVSDLIVPVTAWAKENKSTLQHYTMVAILNEAVASFNQEIEVNSTGIGGQVKTVVMPRNSRAMYSYGLVVQSRAVWTRYLARFNRISTIYGYLYLQDGWQEVLARESERFEIPAKLVPYLIYSASIKSFVGQWKLSFNIHHPNTSFGRKKRVEGRKKLKEIG